jgi:hypothetical protein
MTLTAVSIRPARADDEQGWRKLWRGYCDFYEVELPHPVISATWRRIPDPDAPIGALVAAENGTLVGFANYVIHEYTWSGRSASARLYWLTRAEKRGARRLYDRFTPADGFIRYTLALYYAPVEHVLAAKRTNVTAYLAARAGFAST